MDFVFHAFVITKLCYVSTRRTGENKGRGAASWKDTETSVAILAQGAQSSCRGQNEDGCLRISLLDWRAWGTLWPKVPLLGGTITMDDGTRINLLGLIR